jgi:Tfp pilus assembly protein PilF
MSVVRDAFAARNYSDEVLKYVTLSIEQAPSCYQPPFLLASYYANRIEEPDLTRRGFEAALRRYPFNGRLHLNYAQWLFTSSQNFIRLTTDGAPTGRARQLAETHVEAALRLEPNLTRAALNLLENHRVLPERWSKLVPDTLSAQRQLFPVLARAGYRTEALELLRHLLQANQDIGLFREATNWALAWGDAELSLESARRWQEMASGRGLADFGQASLQVARVHLRVGDFEAAYQVTRSALQEIERRASESSTVALELLCGMANEFLRDGQPAMAESLFAEAITRSPRYAPACLGMARTYRRSGNPAAAMELYRKALQLDPKNTEAERELAQLIMERELASENH